jgi:hypothetical protein
MDEFYDDPSDRLPLSNGLSNDEMPPNNDIQVKLFTIIQTELCISRFLE